MSLVVKSNDYPLLEPLLKLQISLFLMIAFLPWITKPMLLKKTLKEELSDKCIIIVAQRISTIMHAEQILVLDNGKIVGKGTHTELLAGCEVYRQIASSQLSKEELE